MPPCSSAAGSARRSTKPVAGQFKHLPKEQQHPKRRARGPRRRRPTSYEVGQQVGVDLFEAGELVDVTGVSKGHGFTGVIARHNFRRGPKSHGSDHHRAPGSIGAGTYPGRVWKGTQDGRPHGRRAGDRQEAQGREGRSRAQPHPRAGVRCPARETASCSCRRRSETMPKTTILNADGADAGSVDLAETLFAAPVSERLIHQAVRAPAGRPPRSAPPTR